MSTMINGVLCQELCRDGDVTEGFDRLQGPTASKAYLCPWGSRFKVAQGFLGLSNTTSVGGLINLLTPLPYPEPFVVGVQQTMYASNIQIKGVGSPTQGTYQAQWTDAIVMVGYACLPWSFSGVGYNQIDPANPFIYAEQNISFSSEWITVPGSAVRYASNSKKLDQDWGFRSPLANLNISLKYIPYLPAQQILIAAQSPISSADYLGVAAGYLLFNGAENHQTFMSDGTFAQTFDMSFTVRTVAPWDFVYNGALGIWDQVYSPALVPFVNAYGNPQRSDLSAIIASVYG